MTLLGEEKTRASWQNPAELPSRTASLPSPQSCSKASGSVCTEHRRLEYRSYTASILPSWLELVRVLVQLFIRVVYESWPSDVHRRHQHVEHGDQMPYVCIIARFQCNPALSATFLSCRAAARMRPMMLHRSIHGGHGVLVYFSSRMPGRHRYRSSYPLRCVFPTCMALKRVRTPVVRRRFELISSPTTVCGCIVPPGSRDRRLRR
ncbi:uncharacterized protein C8Q71DRAFT_770168 [Rhodofomes roseus]|uniref:Uncharacterized protein n=1 Tax=Rhodofomes roseus TaxID=34475 RepID=A0ABQ8KAX7_9APHY|nr:uncharacterized protein C8Q71DRAFT_770168 [Rhodofomes roseus]KAH9834653.1 hypothetical protein C8Q71DRAFT_770168 [Rhodofomes roseus]